MFFFPLLTAVVMLGFGIGALRLNPRRPINQALAIICFLSVLIFAVQLVAKFEGAKYLVDRTSNPLLWIRLKFALIGVLSPLLVWVCYYLVSGRYTSKWHLLLKLTPWITLSAFLFYFPFTEAFKPDDSLPGNISQGPLYYLYFLPMLAGQLAVCISALVIAPQLSGVRKLEFQFITIALGYLSFAAVLVETIYATWPSIPGIQPLTRVLSYLVYLVFGVSAWSVTSRRIYHSGQVALSILERFVLIGTLGIITAVSLSFLAKYEQNVFAVTAVIAGSFLLLSYCDDKLRAWLKLKAENKSSAVVAELHCAANSELDPERLTKHFERILQSFADCSAVDILKLDRNQYAGSSMDIPIAALRNSGFFYEGSISVASFPRAPTQTDRNELHALLVRARIAVLICPRWTTREPTIIIAFGERDSQLPYTHPEVGLMRDLVHVSDALYTRCRLALQAQQADQLASIGRLGLTILHELRNPMSTLKSFSQLLPERINDKAFLNDFAEIVPQEAERVESLAQQLMDLSRPKKYNFQRWSINRAIEDTVALWRPRADVGNINLVTKLDAKNADAMIDCDAIRQVIVNLLRNASEALMHRQEGRMIAVRTRNMDDRVLIEVEDNDPGLPKEIRERLFESFGSNGKPSGIGLGLAICNEIIRAHGGEITADLDREKGCVFKITLQPTPEVIS
jgi:signal transduction histidine kinase